MGPKSEQTIMILGAGRVGRAMALDLASRFRVVAADRDAGCLEALANTTVTPRTLDIGDGGQLTLAVQEVNPDLVINAVPGHLGYRTLETVLRCGKHVVDIAFCPEDTLQLHGLAVEQGVTALVDCGVAPGMPNLFLGRYDQTMEVESFSYMVGGLPRERTFPFEYKAPFSPVDVIEEYTRPARLKENNKVVVKPAMSDRELVHVPGIGTLEAFLTDGLRSLLSTMDHIPSMKEKTLRYPNHTQWISGLMAMGFFDTEPVDLDTARVTPMELTAKLLQSAWQMDSHEPEFTIMRILISGIQDGEPRNLVIDLFDETDRATGTSSMARTTGYTATATATMVMEGTFQERGVFPLEQVGKLTPCFDHILKYQRERKIHYQIRSNLNE